MTIIDITGIDLKAFVQKVYELSAPAGLGFLHFKEGGLSDEEAHELTQRSYCHDEAIHLDYVNGRACKMVVYNRHPKTGEEGLFIRAPWYDHTDKQLLELLHFFGINEEIGAEHNVGCECLICKAKRTRVAFFKPLDN